MEKIKEELNLMQSNPKFYLANYFQDLKQHVHLKFFGNEQAKYIEIINKIEQFEHDYYKRSKPFSTFDQEIESLNEKSIDDLKFKMEEKLFQNKSVLFINKTFLLIVTNAYLRQSSFDNLHKLDYFNRESLIAYLIHKHEFNYDNIEELDAFNVLNSLKEIQFSNNEIIKLVQILIVMAIV